jgi:hypothetical protein
MTNHAVSEERIDTLRRIAVVAVMRYGRFECSGAARLVVFRRKDVMIAYRTPFNPMPMLSEHAKFIATREGRMAPLLPYGIDVWQLDVGKVMSLGWRDGETAIADLYRPGGWEHLLETSGNSSARYFKHEKTPETSATAIASSGKGIGRQSKSRRRSRGR